MKKHKQIEVYNYYKKLYPRALLFFHIKNENVALFQDAEEICQKIGAPINQLISFPDDDLDIISKLGTGDKEIKIIEFRSNNNRLELPDIDIIKKEKMCDY